MKTRITGCRDLLDPTLTIIGIRFSVFEIVGRWRVGMEINTPPAGAGPIPGGFAHLDRWIRCSLHLTPNPH